MSSKRGCLSSLWNPCRTKEPNSVVASEYSPEVIVTLRGDDFSVFDKLSNYSERAPTEVHHEGILETEVAYCDRLCILSERERDTHLENSHFTFSITSVVSESLSRVSSMSSLRMDQPTPQKQATADEVTDSKTAAKDNVAKDEEPSGVEDLAAMKEMGVTKFTTQALAKEKKKLTKIEKSIGTQTTKLQKSRNSLSDASAPAKKHEKELKKLVKTAEAIGVLEVEKDAQNMKIEKLKELLSNRQSLVCVVKRNSVCEGVKHKVKVEDKPQILGEENVVS